MNMPLSEDLIAEANAHDADALGQDYAALDRRLARSGIAIDAIKDRVAAFSIAVRSWGAGRGGTRFAKFPIPGEPTSIHEKLEDCAVINQLSRATPRVSPHFPWDKVSDNAALREEAATLGLGFDPVNSNTFQDQYGQPHSYASGSLSSTDAKVRAQAIEHKIECIEIGRQIGSTHTVRLVEPLQRQQVRRRRSRFGFDHPAPAVPDLQRTGRGGNASQGPMTNEASARAT